MAYFMDIMQKIGVGKCRMQYMEDTLTEIMTDTEGVTTITWQTADTNAKADDLVIEPDGVVHFEGDMIPIVLWVPRKEWDAACKE